MNVVFFAVFLMVFIPLFVWLDKKADNASGRRWEDLEKEFKREIR